MFLLQRGITWLAAIKCARADWPLSVLKASPTLNSRKYLLVFFPEERKYAWVDAFLVRAIDDLPEPLASENLEASLNAVKDTSVVRHFNVKFLTVAMFDIVESFHVEVCICAWFVIFVYIFPYVFYMMMNCYLYFFSNLFRLLKRLLEKGLCGGDLLLSLFVLFVTQISEDY